MQIYGPYRVSTTQPNAAAQRSQPQKPADPTPNADKASVDQLDLSSAASGINRMAPNTAVAGGGEIRIDRVFRSNDMVAITFHVGFFGVTLVGKCNIPYYTKKNRR